MIPEQRRILTANAPVLTSDGDRGRLRQALLSQDRHRLTALVIRYGLFPPRDVVVPVEQIGDIGDGQLRLRLSGAELLQQPAYRRTARTQPLLSGLGGLGGPRRAMIALQYGSAGTAERVVDVSQQLGSALGHPPGDSADALPALRAGQRVWNLEGQVGSLRHLIIDQADQVRELVIRAGTLPRRDVIVPMVHVERIDADRLWLTLDQAAIARLPGYQPDRTLLAAVDRALWADETIRRLDYRSIDVTVRGGVVWLNGYVAASQHVSRAEQIAGRVAGVRQVVNQLVADSTVELAVAQALGLNPDTRGLRLFVHMRSGVAYISGEVPDAGVRALVDIVAASAPGVRAVVNLTRAPDGGEAEDMRPLFPGIGQDIYAVDTRLGVVERVIIGARHRRVTAIVARRWFERTGGDGRLQPDLARQARGLVIPISAVQHITPGGVWLHSTAAEVARFAELGPDDGYRPLDPAEQPPYPYTRAQVLVDRRGRDAARATESRQLGGPAISDA
jgi:osmotically-inducible protein OsmY